MAYCTKCGTQKTNGHCPNCDTHEETLTNETTNHPPSRNKRRKKWLVGILLLVIALSGGGYLFASSYYASANIVDRIVNTIEAGDTEAIRALAIDEGKDLSDEALTAYVDMMQEENRLSTFREDMLALAEGQERDPGHYPAVMEQTEPLFGMFDDFGLRFTEYQIDVSHQVPDDGVEVFYNDEPVNVLAENEDTLTLEKLFPADGQITLRYAGGYGEAEETIQVRDIEDLYSSPDLSYVWEYTGTYVTINSNRSDSYLLVNDEDDNQRIPGTIEFGPVNFEEVETIQAYAEGQFDTLYSDEITIEPGIDTYELLFEEETVEDIPPEELIDSINLHVLEWVEAYKSQDTSYFTMLTADFADEYLTRTANNFAEQRNEGWRYQGRIDRIDYDIASVEVINSNPDRVEAAIDARLNFRSSFYAAGSDPSNTPLTNSISEWTYSLVYDAHEDLWLIDGQQELDSWNPDDEYRHPF